jgi:hypothetical protein
LSSLWGIVKIEGGVSPASSPSTPDGRGPPGGALGRNRASKAEREGSLRTPSCRV